MTRIEVHPNVVRMTRIVGGEIDRIRSEIDQRDAELLQAEAHLEAARRIIDRVIRRVPSVGRELGTAVMAAETLVDIKKRQTRNA